MTSISIYDTTERDIENICEETGYDTADLIEMLVDQYLDELKIEKF